MTRQQTIERRQFIRGFLEQLGYFNFNVTAVANRFKVSRQTIYNDLEHIRKETDVVDIKIAKFEIFNAYKSVFRNSLKELNDMTNSPSERCQWARTLLLVAGDLTKSLEAWGEKPLSTNNASVSSTAITAELLADLWEREKTSNAQNTHPSPQYTANKANRTS